jgi:lysozyme
MVANLAQQLRRDEGTKPSAYQDHLGFWTIGVGRLIDARKGGGLRPDEIEYLLANDIKDRARALLAALPWFGALDDARQGVLLNMAFQLGTAGLLAFKNTLDQVRLGQYKRAAEMMLQSKWATQTPERAARLAKQMESGAWQ